MRIVLNKTVLLLLAFMGASPALILVKPGRVVSDS